MSQAKYSLSFMDYGREVSTMSVNHEQLDEVSILTIGAAVAILRAAIAGISLATLKSERFTQFDNELAGDPPGSPLAQRENKWLVTYEDTTTHKFYKTEIPCAELTLLNGHSEFLDVSTALAPGTVFKAAFDDFVKSPTGGDVSIETVKFVGRNL